MKSTKLLIAISDLWNDRQVAGVKNCLLRGIEEINKKEAIDDIIEELNSQEVNNEIELDSCNFQLLIDVDKTKLLRAIHEAQSCTRLLFLFVGPVSAPWGQFLLSDGIVSAGEVMQSLDNEHCKIVISTLAPCEDWLATEKRHNGLLSVCSYDVTECGDSVALGLNDFFDGVCRRLKVTPCAIKRPDCMSFLKAAQPSVCGFLDKGCSAMPCLFLIDGFSMLFNVGYGRNPEVRHQLKHIAQLDAALLSHVGYNNVLALSCTAQDPESVKINHVFLPFGVSLNDKSDGDSESPYTVDLNNELTKVLSGYKERGTSVSNLSIKGKSGTAVSATQLKAIQLFHKIGYGSLELIPLAPFDEDPDVKKCSEDLKKGKYAMEGHGRVMPSSLSVLLLWKPFNAKCVTKRLLYIGPKSQLRKNLPAVVTALYNNNECLKQAESLTADVANKKPAGRKPPKTDGTVNGTTTESTKKPAAAASTDKSSQPVAGVTHPKKPTSAPAASGADKTARPGTASVTSSLQKTKEPLPTKRPNTAASKLTTDTIPKKGDVVKAADTKKTEGGKTADVKKVASTKVVDVKKTENVHKVVDVKKTENVHKVMDVKKTENVHKVTDTKKTAPKVATKTGVTVTKTDVKKSAPKGQEKTISTENAEKSVDGGMTNGVDKEHSGADVLVVELSAQGGDSHADPSKVVAVGTVECAITEHGEADFCDDTPEEYSADQMKEMGLYDDDEERSSAPLSDRNDLDSAELNVAVGNMAHLPMDGSFYGKDNFDIQDPPTAWNPPLAIPMPARDSITPKKAVKCATPIYVDCVCVPCDLDKEDLRCLFGHVRFETAFLQLDKGSDLCASMDLLLEEWGTEGRHKEVTVLPSLEDELSLVWLEENVERLAACKVRVAPALSRCSILIGGEQGDGACLGFRCEL